MRYMILPVGSYHTPFLGYQTLWIEDPNSKNEVTNKRNMV